jgi:polyphosphate:AMP phosphotransferase
MFESAALPKSLSKAKFKALRLQLRTDLLMAQLDMAEKRDHALVVVIAGVDGAGKSLVAQRMLEWLDPRHITTTAFGLPTLEEIRYPRMKRYWLSLPAKGRMSIVFGSWYHQPLYDRIRGRMDEKAFLEEMRAIQQFEMMLAEENVLMCKLWLHLPRKEREKRQGKNGKGKAATDIRMQEWGDIGKIDYDLAREAVEAMTRITSTAHAPWTVVPAKDPNYRDALSGQVLLDCFRQRDKAPPGQVPAPDPTPTVPNLTGDSTGILEAMDLSLKADKHDYAKGLKKLQHRLHLLTQSEAFGNCGVVAVFEGADAAGKGGCIRRTVRALDPRLYRVHSIAAPSDEELAHPYLWRFWRRIPPRGALAIFDRSWYGRVLVERVEEYCGKSDWKRAYHEIVDFESQLANSGIVVLKFWLQISKDEQLRRFKAREETPFKRFKITEEDWRNREKWDAYQLAAGDMIDRTSTLQAPWTLVPAEDKRHARLTVLRALCDGIEARIGSKT